MKVLYKSKDFTVKKSLIPGAGNGLFVNRDFYRGEVLGPYVGKLITLEEGEKLEARGVDCSHVLDITGMRLDGYTYLYPKKNMLLGYINHAPSTVDGKKVPISKRYNVIFNTIKEFPYVEVVAIRDIPKGNEVYLNYGASFTKLFMKNKEAKKFFLQQ